MQFRLAQPVFIPTVMAKKANEILDASPSGEDCVIYGCQRPCPTLASFVWSDSRNPARSLEREPNRAGLRERPVALAR